MKDWLEVILTGCAAVITIVTAMTVFMVGLVWIMIAWLIQVIYIFSPYLIILCVLYWLFH